MSKDNHKKLGQFFATAICGNDILSSTLYVSGIAALFAGIYAPLVLLAVALVLFFYRSVYREVVEALPVNGGAYNGLLNGTSKTIAALAGVMTILSYVATAVISAKTAVEYLFKFLEVLTGKSLGFLILPVILIILLGFALLVINGVKDSAKVAAAIFIFHIFTLISFILIGTIFILTNGVDFAAKLSETQQLIQSNGGLLQTLFFAFSASLLGVSGFESSANFVEEQVKGVFKKTLRNMAIGVAIFNPLIALIITNALSFKEIAGAKDFLLAEAAIKFGGVFLLGWIGINAFLVLSGAVLTSYIGVSGLVNRMALDGCLPSFLIKENKKGAHYRIVLTFFGLCTSILLITGGDLLSLAGVYTISFLGVMSLFALGNLILRQTRAELKRSYRAPFFFVIIALFSTLLGLIGNTLINPLNDLYFLAYFVPAISLVLLMINREDFYSSMMKFSRRFKPLHKIFSNLYYKSIREEFVIFLHHTNRLYNILNYIDNNEVGFNVKIVHCKESASEEEKKEFEEIIPVLKKAGVFAHMNLKYEYLNKSFCPELVSNYVDKHKISRNKVFIGSIHHHNDFDYSDFGGVRIIF